MITLTSTWVARQEHTDITLTSVTNALLAFAAPRAGERVVDIGCGCGAPTLEFARAVGPSGRVAALDIAGPMLAEGERRASAAGIANVDWRQADPATAALDEYDLLTSAFGVTFFGDRVAAFNNMRCGAAPDARMAASAAAAGAARLQSSAPPSTGFQPACAKPLAVPNAPGMFAFADPEHVTEVLIALIEDNEVDAGQVVGEPSLPSGARLALQSVHQVDDVVKAATGAVADAGPSNGDSEVGLAGPGAADQHDVALLGGGPVTTMQSTT